MAAHAVPITDVDRRWTAVRAGLALLGAGQGSTALFALLAPRSFFGNFPGLGAHWVAAFAPYNEHLVRDYGASFLAVSVLALFAAWRGDRILVRTALGIWLVAAVPHLIFHAVHADRPSGASGVASLATLSLNVVLPLLLLVLSPKEAS
jgi:hypothetical protein